jgi:site-specific recombinase XerD
MPDRVAEPPDVVTQGDLGDELGAFVRYMRRANVSPATIATYHESVRQFAAFLAEHEYPTDVRAIEPRHVEAFLIELLGKWKPATAHNRFRGLQRFFRWYAEVDKDLSYRSPMDRMRPPRLPEYQPRVLSLDELRAVLETCKGRTFEDRRDSALVRLFFNTGARRAEIASLRYSPTDPADRDVNLNRGTVRLFGKGARERFVGIDDKTVGALEDYLRARRAHPHADEPWLWLGKRGRLTDSGIAQAIRDRGLQAGIEGLHPHELRHAWRHHADRAGLSESEMMQLGGWRSPAMLRRYASTTANERAIEASRKVALGDKL